MGRVAQDRPPNGQAADHVSGGCLDPDGRTHDLGKVAAERLLSPPTDIGVRYVEGPKRYSSEDVAEAFSRALREPVKVEVTPRGKWKEAFLLLGFSETAADSYARMTAVSLDGCFDLSDDPVRGATTLETYVQKLATRPN